MFITHDYLGEKHLLCVFSKTKVTTSGFDCNLVPSSGRSFEACERPTL